MFLLYRDQGFVELVRLVRNDDDRMVDGRSSVKMGSGDLGLG